MKICIREIARALLCDRESDRIVVELEAENCAFLEPHVMDVNRARVTSTSSTWEEAWRILSPKRN